jgi:carbonic anhydrase
MLFRLTTLAVILTNAITTEAADGKYNYDETHIWDQVITSGPNECGGSKNSPIAIDDMGCTDYHNYVMVDGTCTFADMNASVTNNGVKIGIKDDATCDKPHFFLPGSGEKYTFAQLHIHLSSEHTINGEYSAAELHMVHVGPKRYSVIGTMIQPDKPDDNAVFGAFVDSFKDARYAMESTCSDANMSCKVKNGYSMGKNLKYPSSNNMHPYKMLSTKDFFHYFGGLTTPPCTQAVWWNLAAKPMNISVRQFAALAEIILKTMDPATDCTEKLTVASVSGSTSRPPQALGDRTVKKLCSKNASATTTTAPGTTTTPGTTSSAEITSYTVGALSFAAAMAAGQLL